ncbi:MAG: DUF1631 domain-containing protein [Cellvibrionaceae bacterium]|nr:DUF1631 domain-containing protein [Cellvibrionaceae bacterium]
MEYKNDGIESSMTNDFIFNKRKLPGILGLVAGQYLESCRQLIEWSFLDAENSLNGDLADENGKIDKLQYSVAAVVEAELTQAFGVLLASNAKKNAVIPTLRSRVKLSVVNGVTFEVEYLLRETALQIREEYSQYLNECIKRLDHLILPSTVSELNNPLEPMLFVEKFINACERTAEIDPRRRRLVYEELQKQMLEMLPLCYRDASEALSRAGILP